MLDWPLKCKVCGLAVGSEAEYSVCQSWTVCPVRASTAFDGGEESCGVTLERGEILWCVGLITNR